MNKIKQIIIYVLSGSVVIGAALLYFNQNTAVIENGKEEAQIVEQYISTSDFANNDLEKDKLAEVLNKENVAKESDKTTKSVNSENINEQE